ncbi:MAG: RluA family pseudouridine synthase [Thiotrichales bacterium]|nr:RluA family pseudouridine synthase [Thiotrichales bacterium]
MHGKLLSPPPSLKRFDYDPSWILYQDQELLVVNKPSGLLSVPGRGPNNAHCLLELLQAEFQNALIVHRLDMDTSGLMVLARDANAHRHLSRQFENRQTRKQYLALCSGRICQDQGEVCLPMRCDWPQRPRQIVDCLHGKFAHTQWQTLQQFSEHFSVLLTPITGRSHQLRVHMQMLGHPILGDNLYADSYALKGASRLMLHAYRLGFIHPSSGRWLDFEQEPDFLYLA